jgi:tetratricopeptide (TPR) repeat protein
MTAREKLKPAAARPPQPDPLVEQYEAGIKAMYRQKWSEAAKHFAKVAESDESDLAGRARQLLETCRAKQESAADLSHEDPFLLAVVHKNNGELAEALQICTRGGRQSKDERFAYLAASIHALSGEREEAAKFLELAIELNPKNRVHAFHDADFASLREDAAFARLFGLT